MFPIILGGITIIGFFIFYLIRDHLDGMVGTIGASLVMGIASALIGLLITAISGSIISGNIENYKSVKVEEAPICALQDNVSIEGHGHGNVFVSSFYVGTELKYYYITETPHGFISGSIPASNTFINYTNEAAHLEVWKNKYVKSDFAYFLFQWEINEPEYYKLYIPEGSITSDINIDLK